MKIYILACVVTFLSFTVYGDVLYFEKAKELEHLDTDFFVKVASVLRDSSAALAGLHDGDRIVGIDGLRVRDRSEYDFLRFYFDEREEMVLTIVRDDRLLDLKIKNFSPIRMCGFLFDNSPDKFTEKLISWNLKPAGMVLFRKMPTSREKKPFDDLLDFFGVKGTLITTQSAMLVALFPARGREDISRLMAGGNIEDRQLVDDILSVYLHLRFNEVAEAKEVLIGRNVKKRVKSLFLKDLLGFYERLCETTTQWESKDLWKKYGVSKFFFTVCYPYPVVTKESDKQSFAFDKKFQGLFDMATAGMVVDARMLSTAAMEYNAAKNVRLDMYLAQIRSSLIDPDNHGGWPYRSSEIWKKNSRAKIVRKLNARLLEKPEERILTAFALLCPALIDGNQELAGKAYEILMASGEREHAIADRMILGTKIIWRLDGGISSVVRDSARVHEKPAFYKYMREACPIFRRMENLGCSYKYTGRRQGICVWVAQNFSNVTKALESPVTVKEIDEMLGFVKKGATMPQLRRAFELVSRDLYEYPNQKRLKDFLDLAGRMPAGEGFDVITHIIAYNYSASVACSMNVGSIFNDYFYKTEKKHYVTLVKLLKEMDVNDVLLDKNIEELFLKFGTPTTSLLFSQKLKQAGHDEQAEFYRRKASNFYYSITQAYGRYPNGYLRWKAFRCFASIPGFEGDANRYRAQVLGYGVDSSYVLAAILDFYGGNVDSVIVNIEKSLGKKLRRDNDVYLYAGEVYRSVNKLRTVLLSDLIINMDLTVAQINKLCGLKRLDRKLLLAKLSENKSDDDSLGFLFELNDGTSVVGEPLLGALTVKTSYADIPLQFSKVQAIRFEQEGRMASVELRNKDVIKGTLDLGVIDVKTSSGSVMIDAGKVRVMMLFSSRADRFCRQLMKNGADESIILRNG